MSESRNGRRPEAGSGCDTHPGDEFTDSSGSWIWIRAATGRYGRAYGTLSQWCRGCLWLKGDCNLRSRLVVVRPSKGRSVTRRYLDDRQLRGILEAQGNRATASGKTARVSVPAASQLAGIREGTWYNWIKRGCPFGAGGKLDVQEIRIGRHRRLRLLRKQVLEIAASIAESNRIVVDGRSLATVAEVCRDLGCRSERIHNSRCHPHSALEGNKLFGVRRPGRTRAGRLKMLWFVDTADVAKIVMYESQRHGPGEGSGGWPTVREAATTLGVSHATIHYWTKHGCRHLNGKRLAFRWVKTKCGPVRHKAKTVDPVQLAQIGNRRANPPLPSDPRFEFLTPDEFVYHDKKGDWGSKAYLMKRHGVHGNTLYSWRDRGLVDTQEVTVPRASGRWPDRWVWLLRDAERKVATGEPTCRLFYDEPYLDGQGQVWLPRRLVHARFDVYPTLEIMRRAGRIHGQQVEFSGPRTRAGGVRWVYLEDDLEREYGRRTNGDGQVQVPTTEPSSIEMLAAAGNGDGQVQTATTEPSTSETLPTSRDSDQEEGPAIATGPNGVPRAAGNGDGADWYYPKAASPPTTNAYGPLLGTKKNLGICLGGRGGRNDRTLERKGRTGYVWVCRCSRQSFAVYFRTQKDWDRAKARALSLQQ